jgi:hypothetical protein
MTRLTPAKRRLSGVVCVLGLAWSAAGCGGDSGVGHVLAVSGHVFVDSQPLRGMHGTVTFVPDLDKGNSTTVTPTGTLDDDGNYTLYYAQGKKGAPPGWYKVQVTAAQLGPGAQMPRPKGVPGGPKVQPTINSKFTNAKTSGLKVEVVENPEPGAYDLKLTK